MISIALFKKYVLQTSNMSVEVGNKTRHSGKPNGLSWRTQNVLDLAGH